MKLAPNNAMHLLRAGDATITGIVNHDESRGIRYYVLDNYLDQRTDHVLVTAANTAKLTPWLGEAK